MDENPTIFISYCWENDEQKEWVTILANLLRKNGVDATLDVFETQKGTTNLYSMMVEKIRDSDYTIIVLTKKYADKANVWEGGVGFETSMLIPYIQENIKKIIPIMNSKWNSTKDVPFYLKGVHYINFSEQFRFDENFKELLHRIYQVDLFNKEPLGKKPMLTPKKLSEPNKEKFDGLIPDFREITDIDKNYFMKESFEYIKDNLIQLLEATKQKNKNFEFESENLTQKKTVYKMFINGTQKLALKIWLGSNFGSIADTINLSYGNYISDSDSSFNEMVICEIGKNKKLELRMTMNIYGNKEANSPTSIAREIWNNIVTWLK